MTSLRVDQPTFPPLMTVEDFYALTPLLDDPDAATG